MPVEQRRIRQWAVLILYSAMLTGASVAPRVRAQSTSPDTPVAKGKAQPLRADAGAKRFSARADAALAAQAASKGEWGLLIADAATGDTLYELNADRYFVPASNMKLFTTALALAKLGADYRFHTTLETHGSISPDRTLDGDLFLVGRGDPNLSNRKFPYELKEEFDGAPEKALAELADSLVAKGVKQITGDVIGDDSYFPREPYPDGWEIGDMVWERSLRSWSTTTPWR
jgi:D-alanyl-D-alanine carboxypeptidase